MKKYFARIVPLVIAIASLGVCGQAQESYEAPLRELRIAVKAMTENPPAPDAPDAANYQRRVREILVQLQRLLLKKSGYLEGQINGMRPAAATPQVRDHIAEVSNHLKSTEAEIQEIDRLLGQTTEQRAVAQPEVFREPARRDDEIRLSSEEAKALKEKLARERSLKMAEDAARIEARKNFNATVGTISPEALKEAAISPELNSSPPRCNERGFPQVKPYSLLDGALCRVGKDIADGTTEFDLESQQGPILTILIAKLLKTSTNGESYSAFVTDAQANRMDQQIGAGPISESSTSLVSKGGIPYLFGFAVEHGAAEQVQKDTTVTFRFNPAGVINLFANQGFITGFEKTENDPFLKFLRKTAIGLTFDTSRGDTPGTFTGTRQQLSQINAQVEFLNERDPRHKRYRAEWERLVADEGVKLANAISKVTIATTNWADPDTGDVDMTFKDAALQAWLLQTQQKVVAAKASVSGVEAINEIAQVISEQADQLPVAMVSDQTIESITEFAAKNQTYIEKKNELFDKIAKGKIFTLDYTNKREVNAPDTSTFNFIAATGTGTRVDLTANGSFTFFHTRPLVTSLTSPRPGRFRDFQFAGELAVPFRSGFDFWFSGRYERLLEDATTFGGAAIPNTKGDIAVGQFGFNIPIKSLGIKFPVSFTVANRTELVKEKEVRGNFGFTFNWDTIFSKLKPF